MNNFFSIGNRSSYSYVFSILINNLLKFKTLLLSLFPLLAIVYSYNFVFPYKHPKELGLVALMAAILLVEGIYSIITKNRIVFKRRSMPVYAFGVFLVIHTIIKPHVTLIDIKPLIWVLSIAFFIVIENHIYYYGSKNLLRTTFWVSLFATNAIIIVGILQFTGVVKMEDVAFKMIGTFENPGPLGIFISIMIPLLILPLFQLKKTKWIILYSLYVLALATFIFLTKSRTAMLVIFTIAFFFLIKTIFKITAKKFKVILPLLSVIIIGSIVYGLYTIRPESANGRLLIWKISYNTISNDPLFGSGIGRFRGALAEEQISYFGSGASNQEQLLADNPTFAFNEFIELTVETGIVGLILFLIIIFYAFKSSTAASKRYNIGMLGLIAIIVASMLSYPFSIVPNIFSLCFYLALAFGAESHNKAFDPQNSGKYLKLITPSLYVISAICLIYFLSVKVPAYKTWEKAHELDLKEARSKLALLTKIKPALKNDPDYCANFGAVLSIQGLYKASNEMLDLAEHKILNESILLFQGNNFEKLDQLDSAAIFYKKATLLTPVKLYPKYRLFNLYSKYDAVLATEIANQIINQPIKVKSPVTDMIKYQANTYLRKQNTHLSK